ncbi:uncharacterized protein KGF55_004913 [Candida pseudojiufengensis]|uniref:uncharacterized protein n=1 Tax=Candida pseudojiufengensis TaxID=497109 RepID=UPI0022240B01|nr:uncharacterized protein KGF55_004913 [Candida pseudojiufengensis]KAI5960190.1 hypothetical protein KGF55_004913 [Candida pseudojiufengensis]
MNLSLIKKDNFTNEKAKIAHKLKSMNFLNNKIIDFDEAQEKAKDKDELIQDIIDYKIPTLPLPNNYQKRLPKLNCYLKTRLNFLSMEIYNSSNTTNKFLNDHVEELDLDFVAFTNKFKIKLYKSIKFLVNSIIEISKIWYNSPMFSFEVIKIILEESSNFIVGNPFDPILIECFCFTLFSDYEILNLVKYLNYELKKSKFNKFKKDISLNMLIVFNLPVKNDFEFANSLISKFITLWVYALMDIN